MTLLLFISLHTIQSYMALTSYAGLKDPMNLGHFLFHSPPLVGGVEWLLGWAGLGWAGLGVGTLLIKVGGGVVPVFAGCHSPARSWHGY